MQYNAISMSIKYYFWCPVKVKDRDNSLSGKKKNKKKIKMGVILDLQLKMNSPMCVWGEIVLICMLVHAIYK